jgi:hypothetical protein
MLQTDARRAAERSFARRDTYTKIQSGESHFRVFRLYSRTYLSPTEYNTIYIVRTRALQRTAVDINRVLRVYMQCTLAESGV